MIDIEDARRVKVTTAIPRKRRQPFNLVVFDGQIIRFSDIKDAARRPVERIIGNIDFCCFRNVHGAGILQVRIVRVPPIQAHVPRHINFPAPDANAGIVHIPGMGYRLVGQLNVVVGDDAAAHAKCPAALRGRTAKGRDAHKDALNGIIGNDNVLPAMKVNALPKGVIHTIGNMVACDGRKLCT